MNEVFPVSLLLPGAGGCQAGPRTSCLPLGLEGVGPDLWRPPLLPRLLLRMPLLSLQAPAVLLLCPVPHEFCLPRSPWGQLPSPCWSPQLGLSPGRELPVCGSEQLPGPTRPRGANPGILAQLCALCVCEHGCVCVCTCMHTHVYFVTHTSESASLP